MTTNIWIIIGIYVGLSIPAVMAASKWIRYMELKVYEKYWRMDYFSYTCKSIRSAYAIACLLFIGWGISVPTAVTVVLIRYLKLKRQIEKEEKEMKMVNELVDKLAS